MPSLPTYSSSRARALILCAVLSLTACEELAKPTPDGGSAPGALQREGDHVTVTPNYRPCSTDDDCTLVGTSCNGCCERDAISTSLVESFQQESAAACASYSGAICDCAFLPLVAVCEEGRCAARAPDEESDGGAASQSDPCAQLDGIYQSVSELECGLGATGVSFCNWGLKFSAQGWSWHHSDVEESGTFSCENGQISVSSGSGASYAGVITADGKLTFDGQAYVRAP